MMAYRHNSPTTRNRPQFGLAFFAILLLSCIWIGKIFWGTPAISASDVSSSISQSLGGLTALGGGGGGNEDDVAQDKSAAEHEETAVALVTPEPRLDTTWHKQIAIEIGKYGSDLGAVETAYGKLNRSRTALLMENRPLPYLIPLLLHFISTVPPEWSFRFMGSDESLALLNSNPTIRRYVQGKKLFLDLIPYDVVEAITSYNTVNYLLSRAWFYREWLWPSEWLFLFQDDSMICSSSNMTVNDFLEEGWSFLGVAHWEETRPSSTGGGFSLRRIPHLLRQLETFNYEQWADSGRIASEDYYFSMALSEQPWAKQPNGVEAIRWAVVNQWHEDEKQMPLGFHPFSSDGMFRGDNGAANQAKAYKWCPELAIISVGRWDCTCSPNGSRPGGLGG